MSNKVNPWIATAMQLPAQGYEVECLAPDGSVRLQMYIAPSAQQSSCWANLPTRFHFGLEQFPYWRTPRTAADDIVEGNK